MAPLKALVALALLIASPASAASDPTAPWSALIGEASVKFGIPQSWIRQVMRVESGGRPGATSRAGAIGLMQLMRGTWNDMRSAHALGNDPYDPHDNVLAGAAYLRAMYDRFGYPGMFAAYNAGPGRYAAHLAAGRALPAETRSYLAEVAGTAAGARAAAPVVRQVPAVLFALGAEAPSRRAAMSGREDRLFAIRR